MIKLSVYNLSGDKVKDLEVSSRLFGRAVKPEVVHQVVVAQNANSRHILAHTLGKGDVRGGGKKPWKQKGTGRARHGSIRSPLWAGGGITFGPTKDRNFSKRVNKKQKQLALAMCLSDKVNEKSLTIFDKIEFKDVKTKELNNWIKTIREKIVDLKDSKKILIVLDSNDKGIRRIALNIDKVETIVADSLNCVDLLKYDTILMTEKSLEVIDQHYKQINEVKKK